MTAASNPDGPAVVVDPYSSGAMLAPAFLAAGVPVTAVVTGPQPPAVYAASYRRGDFTEIITFDGDLEPVIASSVDADLAARLDAIGE